MKALLIDAAAKTIEEIEIADRDAIVHQIGFPTLESDEVGAAGDRLFFDEECFIRGTEGRFQVDSLIPVAGKGVVVGADDSGSALSDVALTVAELQARTKFQ